MAALRAPFSETQATGTPGGICTMARMASRPPRALFSDARGTPITGRSVYAAAVPGRAAAIPAAAMITRTPRSAAVDAYSATARGSLCADRTRSSFEIPRSLSSSIAGSIASRSDSEPMRIPTSGPASSNSSRMASGVSSGSDTDDVRRDIPAEGCARKVDGGDGVIGSLTRFADRGGDGRHVKGPPSRTQKPPVAQGRTGVENERAAAFCRLDTPYLDPAHWALRVPGGGEDDRDGRVPGRRERRLIERPHGRRGEGGKEVALEEREDGLRLGVAEAAVELEHARALVGEHETGVEHAEKRCAAPAELGEHRLVNGLDELVDLSLVQERHR